MLLLVIFLNIVVLGKLAISDVKTHAVPKIITALYVLGSLLLTNLYFFIGAFIVCVLMFLTNPIMKSSMGPGDRKVLFGLALQIGWQPVVFMMSFIFFILFARKATGDKNPVPLIPFILIGFIIWVFYSMITKSLITT